MDRLGLLNAPANSALGKAMRAADPFPDRDRSLRVLRSLGIDIRPSLTSAADRTAAFEDRSSASIDAVIWAVGYRDTSDWTEISRGTAGMYRLGRPWLRNRASGLILGASRDAEIVVKSILQYLDQS